MSEVTGIDPEEEEVEEEAEAEPRIGCLASLIPVTTPGCASLLTAVFLVTTVITVWLVFWFDANNVPWRHAYSFWRILGIVILGIMLPYVVYKTISLWLEGSPQAFPELDSAWRAGLHALASNELSIGAVPIFLITGSSGETQEKSLMNASGLSFSVQGVPQGPAPIHWYANSEAIYLFCSDVSWTSALASLREELAQEAIASGLNIESPLGINTFEVPAAPQPAPAPPPAAPQTFQPSSSGIRGTLELNQFVDSAGANTPTPSLSRNAPAPASLRGTLMFGDSTGTVTPEQLAGQTYPSQTYPTQPFTPPQSAFVATPGNRDIRNLLPPSDTDIKRKPVLLSHQYSSSCLQELQYLGQLVRQARQPVCTINGILSLIQIESIHSTPVELEELQKALRGDLETIRQAFRMRVPVTALVVGLEKERGFRELVRRVGPERALGQRFGKRFDVQAIPTKEELTSLGVHICGVFEDWAYALFREEQALMRPGNTRLYELLSKVRCNWKTRLSEILSGGFGCEPVKNADQDSLLMSGCYLAATGETPDRQAFVKGVINKLNEEQELIEWTPEALQANQKQNTAASLGMLVTVGLLISLLLMFLLLG